MKREQINSLKEIYPEGTLLILNNMEGEPQMKQGLLGRVEHVDDIGQIHCAWENGSGLALNRKLDSFSKVQNMKSFKLYMPLEKRVLEDENYIEVCNDLIDQNTISKAMTKYSRFLPISGLVDYMDEGDLKDKFITAHPSVEERNSKIYGVADCYIKSDLNDLEVKQFKEYWSGQMSDGWGEGFEQQPIMLNDKEYYVSFWNFSSDYFIATSDEFELSLNSEPEIQMY
jgi:hypothetical protein